MLLLTLPLLAAGLVAAPAPADTLRAQIRQADTQLFAAAFEACDADKAAAMTTEDMEFFHDKDGKSASNREDFRRSVASLCSSARKGGWRCGASWWNLRCRCFRCTMSEPWKSATTASTSAARTAWNAGPARPASSRSGAAWTGTGWPNG